MCDEGTGDEAMWYGPNVTCAKRDSAIVWRSAWGWLSQYEDGSARFRWDEERVASEREGGRMTSSRRQCEILLKNIKRIKDIPYGLPGDQAGLASPLAIPLPLVAMLNPLADDEVSAVVELDRDRACDGCP